MYSNLTKHRKNIAVLALLIAIVMVSLSGRLGYLMLFCSEHYSAMAEDLHQRERTIKAARGWRFRMQPRLLSVPRCGVPGQNLLPMSPRIISRISCSGQNKTRLRSQ